MLSSYRENNGLWSPKFPPTSLFYDCGCPNVASRGRLVGASKIVGQGFVNMGCSNGRVAWGDCNLGETRDALSRRINSIDRRALMGIDFKASHIVCFCTQFGREVRSNTAAERWIHDI